MRSKLKKVGLGVLVFAVLIGGGIAAAPAIERGYERYKWQREFEERERKATVTDKRGLDALDQKFGFRDVQLDAEAGTFGSLIGVEDREMVDDSYFWITIGLLEIDEPNLVRWYRRVNEDLKLGPFELERVFYGTLDDRVIKVVAKAKGANCPLFRIALEEAYGRPPDPKDHPGRNWQGSRVKMTLSEIKNETCWLLVERMDEAKLVRAAQATRDNAEKGKRDAIEAAARKAAAKL